MSFTKESPEFLEQLITNPRSEYCLMGEVVITSKTERAVVFTMSTQSCINIIFHHPDTRDTVFLHADSPIDLPHAIDSVAHHYRQKGLDLNDVIVNINGGIGARLALFGRPLIRGIASSFEILEAANKALVSLGIGEPNFYNEGCQTRFSEYRVTMIPMTAIEVSSGCCYHTPRCQNTEWHQYKSLEQQVRSLVSSDRVNRLIRRGQLNPLKHHPENVYHFVLC